MELKLEKYFEKDLLKFHEIQCNHHKDHEVVIRFYDGRIIVECEFDEVIKIGVVRND